MKNTSVRNVRSTCESIEEHASPSLLQRPRDADEHQPSPWSCPSGQQPFSNRIEEGLAVIRPESMPSEEVTS